MMTAALVIGVLLTLGFLWLVWKFFTKLFKHVVIMLILTVLGVGFFYFRYHSFSTTRKSDIGKHAYMKNSGVYLGEVVAEGEDSVRGKVWIIRPLGSNYQVKYAKSKVTLKDKMELKPEPTPSPDSKPLSDNKKTDQKKKN
ncbi:MAG: hypothetical protein J2P21_15660 [Chloracidobacterium sp.]|nr:hypothetical protein [Chloracidobacterium sp.]